MPLLAFDQSHPVAGGEAQRAKLGQNGCARKSSNALTQLAGSNVREEASATLWERLPLLHGCFPGPVQAAHGA